MTDLMTREVNDSGEIPRVDAGETTRRLHVDGIGGPLHTIRRSPIDTTGEQPLYTPATIGDVTPPTAAATEPTAVLALVGSCRRIDTSDEDEFEVLPTVPPIPMPVPDPQPDPQVDELWEAEEPVYVGRHRNRSIWERLVTSLATAVRRNVGAL